MRRPKPWYNSDKNAWYVVIDGTRHRLGPHPDGAPPPKKGKAGFVPPEPIADAFHLLMVTQKGHAPQGKSLLVCQVCDLFLQWSERNHEKDTFNWYSIFLNDFCGKYGRLKADQLIPNHVTRWLDGHPEWDGGRRNAITCVKRAFNWAASEGILTPNPLRGVKKPPGRRRERILTADEKREILGAIKDQHFRDFVFAMQETGCRPSEVSRVTAAHANLDVGVWVFREHKTAGKTERPRVVYLTPAMVELTRELVAKHPDGPLFRGPRGGRLFTRNGIRCRFKRLREKLPHLKGVVSYCYRHSFATDALVNGVGVAQVAELLGHRDVAMVAKHYGHLAEKVEHLREAARKATQS